MEYQACVEQILLDNCAWDDTDSVRELVKDNPDEALAQVMGLLKTIGAAVEKIDGDMITYTTAD